MTTHLFIKIQIIINQNHHNLLIHPTHFPFNIYEAYLGCVIGVSGIMGIKKERNIMEKLFKNIIGNKMSEFKKQEKDGLNLNYDGLKLNYFSEDKK